MTQTVQPSKAPSFEVPANAPAAVGRPAALKRRVPKYADLAPLIKFKKPEFSNAA
jgi:L-lactate dehydrogenase (cytochrome)